MKGNIVPIFVISFFTFLLLLTQSTAFSSPMTVSFIFILVKILISIGTRLGWIFGG